ncbi:hypothetical protein IAD21_06139 [Abditibacteriota bacterium]|nr:hypothetical protein IAD21_06139 [Abditibacteriota bacterium]
MSLDVFISYSTKDKLTADAVCNTLESRGIRCWIAPRDITPGQDWSDAIIDGLSAVRVFVLLLSSSSNISEQVKREVQNAVAEGLPIVPFRLEDVALSKHMRYFIGTPHWLDALTPPLEAHLERLAKTVCALLQTTDQDQIDSVLLLEEGLNTPVPPPVAKEEWNPDTLRRIERELAFFLGPMARMMVHQAALTTFDSMALVQMVSRSIARDEERARFLETCERLFGNPPTQAPAPIPVPAPVPMAQVWDPIVLQKIERQFAVHIGPLSRILVKRASQKARNVDEIYHLLAENLPTPRERDAFLAEKRT